jgi:signal transduction histidine kinase
MKETFKIIVVDDEEGMRLAVARALQPFTLSFPDLDEEIDFVTTVAASGEEALELIGKDPPHILLLDHKLPGLTGLDVLERLAADKCDILTVMITAYASLETAIQATKLGAFDFLAKPFTPAELKNVVRKASGHLLFQRQARKLLEEKRQIRFQFLSVLAHELKAPLSAIEGYLFIMKDRTAGDDPATYDHIVDRCLVRIEGMRKLIFDLLDLTRIESGQKKRDLSEVDLVEVVREAIEVVLPDAAKREITITFDAKSPLLLWADHGEMEIIANNLLTNAVKYNRDKGTVTVMLKADEKDVIFQVSDTGIGMSQQEQGRLFGEFARIKNSKTTKVPGSGLGLSIVRRLARLYGGDVSVTSIPGEGSTFTVVLKNATAPACPGIA